MKLIEFIMSLGTSITGGGEIPSTNDWSDAGDWSDAEQWND